MKRRHFIQMSALTGASAWAVRDSMADDQPRSSRLSSAAERGFLSRRDSAEAEAGPALPDLSPAKWIWYPSERTLPNTFILFRRAVKIAAQPVRATGWIVGDSRYKLEVNGQRIQWGPAPCDPRWTEADPVDLTSVLTVGENVIGVTVLYYGHGDGTWPLGRPGFLFSLKVEYSDGGVDVVTSDESWRAFLCRAWAPGAYKRWYLRALQEQFDARLYPDGWSTSKFSCNEDWLSALALNGSPNQPAICTGYEDYLNMAEPGPSYSRLQPRSIPLVEERLVPVKRLAETLWIKWLRPATEYFENRGPNCFVADRSPSAIEQAENRWQVHLEPERGAVLTFELAEQIVGFPFFTIDAPAGTVVDLVTQEAHKVGGDPLLYTTMNYSWCRFICREGANTFECFDFESLRWLQLHIQGRGSAVVHSVGVRRRLFPWRNAAEIWCDDPRLQSLFEANINSIRNSAIDTIVDGHGRERQQYVHVQQVSTTHLVFGDSRLPRRFLNTWSQGMTKEGYFLDCWPAVDRLVRIAQRQLDLSSFGPILDVGVRFAFAAWDHYMLTGDREALLRPYIGLLKFSDYLISLADRDKDGLLPVVDLGTPCVWLDFRSYKSQRNKQCGFNLYVAAMFDRAIAPMCDLFGDENHGSSLRTVARELRSHTVRRFWSEEHGLFVDNLPWLKEECDIALTDMTLAWAVLFDQCPNGDTLGSIKALADCPKEMGIAYPENATWRLWALASVGSMEVVLRELRSRWASLPSVALNNTLQEFWEVEPDSISQWSHAAVAPLWVAYSCILGLRPLAPGFRRAELKPELGDLGGFRVVTYTEQGPLRFASSGRKGGREITVTIPSGCLCDLVIGQDEEVELDKLSGEVPVGYARYRLPSGQSVKLHLRGKAAQFVARS